MIPVAILAGGLATRLLPITQTVPKVLVPVAGKPFLEHQLAYLRGQGIMRVVLCVGHLGEMVRAQYGDGAAHGVHIDYSFDGPVLLGTGGAIRQALPLLGPEFFVLYGDSYLPIDFGAVLAGYRASGKPALMTVYRNEGRWDTSNVWFENGAIRIYDKKNRTPEMSYIDYGLSLFRASVFEALPPGPIDLAAIMSDLSRAGDLAGYEAPTRFYEIGSHAGLAELDAHLTNVVGPGLPPCRRASARRSRVETSLDAASTGACATNNMTFTEQYLSEVTRITSQLPVPEIDRMADLLASVREREGRLFILGVGGSAANASHAVNDFRKLCGFECYAPTDNVSELTARANDEGWTTIFEAWLRGSRLAARDGLLVFSVGGGNLEKNVSPNLVTALQYAKQTGSAIAAIVGRDGGFAATVADACVIVPTVNPDHVTPHAEAFQAVVWHLLVTHPQLKRNATKW